MTPPPLLLRRRARQAKGGRGPMFAAVAGVLSLMLILVVTADALNRYGRARAVRTGQTIAAYLAIVAPRAGARAPAYHPARLLAQARALATLPGFGAGVEVYHGTAPLIHATAPPLPPAVYDSLRWGNPALWHEGRALVALGLPKDSTVVGAIAVTPRPDSPSLLSPLLAIGALFVLVLGGIAVRDPRPAPVARYALAALVFGAAAGIHVRRAARVSVDGWMVDARLLVQEAVARRPRGRVPLVDLGRMVPGATLSRGEAAPVAPRRIRSPEGPTAAVAVRLSTSRWLELRMLPAEPRSGSRVLLLVLLAGIGPGALGMARWRMIRSRRAKPRGGRWRMLRDLLTRGA